MSHSPLCNTFKENLTLVNWVIIDSGNGLSPGLRQAITWTNGLLSIGLLGTSFSEILIRILSFSFKKYIWNCHLPKWWPFCPGRDELKNSSVPLDGPLVLPLSARASADTVITSPMTCLRPAPDIGWKWLKFMQMSHYKIPWLFVSLKFMIFLLFLPIHSKAIITMI